MFSILSLPGLCRGLGTTVGRMYARMRGGGVFCSSYRVSKRRVCTVIRGGRFSGLPKGVPTATERTFSALLRAESKRLYSLVVSHTALRTVLRTKGGSNRGVVRRCTRATITVTSVGVTMESRGANGGTSFVGGTVIGYSRVGISRLARTTLTNTRRVTRCLRKASCHRNTSTLHVSPSTFRH